MFFRYIIFTNYSLSFITDLDNVSVVPQTIRISQTVLSGDIALKKAVPIDPAPNIIVIDQLSSDNDHLPPKSSTKDELVVALYKFESNVVGDLIFKRDDIIKVISKDDSGWWTGTCSGQTGIFPSNYVKPLE